MKRRTNSSTSEMPVVSIILLKASSKFCTLSREAWRSTLSFTPLQFPLFFKATILFSSSTLSVPFDCPPSWTVVSGRMPSSVFRSWPSVIICSSKSSCSLRFICSIEAISICAESRASYAAFESSMMFAICFFFSYSSFSTLEYMPSKTARSFLRSSISTRSFLLCDKASLNFISDLSRRFSRIRICFCTIAWFSRAALTPPMTLR
mmetsp:Transcript_33970/g.45901  ORF Transcript_33970/g.45901 Transcript_33970/m.45901 type:complete len:206 (+) Transcript_33970:1075-1692(+)